MTEADKPPFIALLQGVFAYHRQALSSALIGIYWRGCERWSLEQVSKAFDSLTADAEAGKFLPKIGDLTRVLEGTPTDRGMIAWGTTLDAMSSVGAYRDVVFDDPAIHACIGDLGGWPKLARTPLNELGYVQAAFCKAHRAYTGLGTFDYPPSLMGDRSPDDEFVKAGLPVPAPVLVGDPVRCQAVYLGGTAGGKTRIAFNGAAALALVAMPHRESGQDVPWVRRAGGAP